MSQFKTLALLVSLGLGLGAVAAYAGPVAGPGEGRFVPATQPAQGGGTVSVADLGQMLQGLGYQVTPIKGNNGQVDAYDVKLQDGDWSHELIIDVSPSGQVVWLAAGLGHVDANAPADLLMKLLAVNNKTEPAFFSVDPQSHTLLLQMPITNRGLTADGLRAWIEYFCKQIQNTKDLWQQPAAPAKFAPGIPS